MRGRDGRRGRGSRRCRGPGRRGRRGFEDPFHEIGRRPVAYDPVDQVVRVGEDAFAVLTYAGSSREAGKIAAHLQSRLAADGFTVTFGWAAYPQDGSNALSLYRAADERLYARRLIHRQTTVVPLQGSATSS